MIITSNRFNSDTQSSTLNIIPIIIVDNDPTIRASTQSFMFDNNYYSPLLLSIPSIKESVDFESRRYKISNVTIQLSNYEVNGSRLSSTITSLINRSLQIYWKSQNCNTIDDCILIYDGVVRNIRQSPISIDITAEDISQANLHRDLPINIVPTTIDIIQKHRGKRIPMVYGHIDYSPLIQYVKSVDVITDEGLEDINTKVFMIPDAVDPSISEQTINIWGYLTYDQELYTAGTETAYSTPLHMYDNDYSQVINLIGSSYADKSIYVSQGVIYFEKLYNISNNTVRNHIADNIVNTVYYPVLTSGWTSNHKQRLFESWGGVQPPDHAWRIYRLFYNHLGDGWYPYNNSDSITTLPDEGNLINMFTGNQQLVWKFRTLWDKYNASPYYIRRFLLSFSLSELLVKYDTGKLILDFDGFITVHHLQGSPSNNQCDVECLRLGDQGSNQITQIFNDLHSTGDFTKVIFEGENVNTDYLTIIFRGRYLSVKYEFNMYANKIGALYQLKHQDTKVLDRDYYATVHGRYTPGSGAYRYRAKLPSEEIEDWGWLNSTDIGVYNNNNGLYFVKNMTDNVNYIFVDEMEIERVGNSETSINVYFSGTIADPENADNWQVNDAWGIYGLPDEDNPDGTIKLIRVPHNEEDLGSLLDGMIIRNPADIIIHILKNEVGYTGDINQNDYDLAIIEHEQWLMDFTIASKINSKKLLESIGKSSKFIPKFRSDGSFGFNTIKSEYSESDVDIIISNNDTIDYQNDRTSINDLITRVKVLYKLDYADGDYKKDSGYQDIGEIFGADYDLDYYGANIKETTVVFESDYIRNDPTAIKLREWLLYWNCNQHNIIKVRLPLKYLPVEIGDICRFESLLDGTLLFGEDYTVEQTRNGQVIYPYFMVTETNKRMEFIELKLIQMHRAGTDFIPMIGDLNYDNSVDGLDLVMLSNYLIGNQELTEHQKLMADINQDGVVDELDLQALLEIILG